MPDNTKAIKGTFWTALIFYMLIAFEFFYMASPFAVYFYSVYGPGLSFISNVPWLAWSAGFFMPHIVESTGSLLLNSLMPIGLGLTAIGLIAFIVTAAQVYYAKIFKKGMVTGGIYDKIRHPQYISFMISSVGMLMLWPRYLNLIMFITMIFGYYFLARAEESECLRKFGRSYRDYMNRTNMFFPWGKCKYSNMKRKRKLNFLHKAVIYIVVMFAAIQGANIIKEYSIASLHKITTADITAISVFDMPQHEMKKLLDLSAKQANIQSSNKKIIAYIMPSGMYISEIPMVRPGNAINHIRNYVYDQSVYKVCFCESGQIKAGADISAEDILFNTRTLKPIAEIHISVKQHKILHSIKLDDRHKRYYGLAEPIF